MNFPVSIEMPRYGPFILTIDAPDYEAAIYEMKKLANEICQIRAIDDFKSGQVFFNNKMWVGAECLGFRYHVEQEFTPEFGKMVKDSMEIEKKAKRPIDLESLKHDIQTAIPMILQGVSLEEIDKFPMIYPTIAWMYYMLHKHYGDEIPEELQKAQSRLQERLEGLQDRLEEKK